MPTPLHIFGFSVALLGESAFIGALFDDDQAVAAGAAYVFHRSATTGLYEQTQKLTASDPAAGEAFGRAMAANDDTVIISAFFDDGTKGAAYAFRFNALTGAWEEQQKITASDRGSFGPKNFGWSGRTLWGTHRRLG